MQTCTAAHNRAIAEGDAGVRIVVRPLPIKRPWLNPIDPNRVHGKQRVARPLPRRGHVRRVPHARLHQLVALVAGRLAVVDPAGSRPEGARKPIPSAVPRKRVPLRYDAGAHTRAELAELVSVSRTTVYREMQRRGAATEPADGP